MNLVDDTHLGRYTTVADCDDIHLVGDLADALCGSFHETLLDSGSLLIPSDSRVRIIEY